MNCKQILVILLVSVVIIQAAEPKDAKPKKGSGKSSFDIEGSLPKKPNFKADGPSLLDEFKERVVALNHKTFDKIVLDRTKYVFVEFYANWCGHCKNLIPHWQRLADHFKNNTDVVIAKVDAEQHKDISTRYGIQGYPTLVFFSKGNKRGEWYRGRRDADSFISWVENKLKIEFTAEEISADYEAIEELKKKEEQRAQEARISAQKIKDTKRTQKTQETEQQQAEPVPAEKVPKVDESKSRVPTEKKAPVETKAAPKPVIHEEIDANDEGYFNGFSGTQLYFQAWAVEGAKSVVVLLHGLGDHSGSYKHIVNHVVPKGFSVYSFDLRGHGRSQGEKGHINDWNEYREDLRLFVNMVKKEENVKKVFLAGFDLGGLVALDYSIRYKAGIQGVVALSPLLVPLNNTGSLAFLDEFMVGLWPSFAAETQANLNQQSRDEESLSDLRNDPLQHNAATVKLHSEVATTIQWVQSNARDLKAPVFLAYGSADSVVPPSGSQQLFNKIGANDKTLEIYDGYYHRLFDDQDKEKVLDDVTRWLDSHV